MVEGTWIESPALVKKAFFDHFKSQFEHPSPSNIVLERDFSNKVSLDQVEDLERTVSKDEIKRAVWDCGVDKSLAGWVSLRILLTVLDYYLRMTFCASKIGFRVEMPFTYLGSKVGSLMTRSMSWNEVVERMVTRLSRWKLKTLSIGGRLTLLKSVLGSIPLYHMAMYKVPKKVLHVMERIRARFFIGAESTVKKHSWVSWKKTMASKDYGGLGVASLFALNRALIFKWIWLKAGYPSIWLSIIQEMGVIRDMGIDILNYIKPKCGDGSSILFWEDNWRSDAAFKDLYPRLYMLENGGRELQQLESIKEQISGCILSNSKDRWTWSLEGSGEFTVSSLRKAIDSIFLPNERFN
ncbi:hypothetical protein Tco_0847271 [Tanacetum coccineum]